MLFHFFAASRGTGGGAPSSNSAPADGGGQHGVVERLPILIIPGFLSSGLKIETSKDHPHWKGKRLWLNLGSMGVEKLSKVALKPWETLQQHYFPPVSQQGQKGKGIGPPPPPKVEEGHKTTTSQFPIRPAADDGDEQNTGSIVHHQNQSKEENDEDCLRHQQEIRTQWLRHIVLKADLKTEQDGIEVRPIPGLEGVNYLYPSFLTTMLTYVFGPLIECLVKTGGYTADVNLQAAPWDWRLPPCQLEARDQYFSKTLKQIESMYETCHQMPVVLLSHSLGANVAQYMLNFALATKGQAWIDKHIYAFVPVAGTHLGVPKSIKQVALVDHSCVDPFLSFEESVLFARGFGSCPWMFPRQLPPDAPPVAWMQPQGILEIRVLEPIQVMAFVKERCRHDQPKKYKLQAALGKVGVKTSVRLVSSLFWEITPAASGGTSDFTTETFCFVTNPEKLQDQNDLTLQFYLREPDSTKSAKARWVAIRARLLHLSFFLWILGWLLELTFRVMDLVIFPLSLLNQLTVGASAVLAVSEPINLREISLQPNKAVRRTVTLTHVHDCISRSCFHSIASGARKTNLHLELVWKPHDASPPPEQLCNSVATPSSKAILQITNEKTGKSYQGMSGHDFLYKEGRITQSYLKAAHKLYDHDPNEPYGASAVDAPHVQRVHAIYGVNVPTEVGALYCRTDACVSTRRPGIPLHQLDTSSATLASSQERFIMDGYLVKEVSTSTHRTGDGTVPYWSLSSVQSWKDSVKTLSVFELEGAEHREILSDKRFFKEVLRYCRRRRKRESM